MAFDINKIKNMFSKKTNNKTNNENSEEEYYDEITEERNSTARDEEILDGEEIFDEIENENRSSNFWNNLTPEKKKKIMIGAGVGIAGIGGLLVLPSLFTSVSDNSYENEMEQMQQQVMTENKVIQEKQSPLKELPKEKKERPIVETKEETPKQEEAPKQEFNVEKDKQILESLANDENKIDEIINVDKINITKDLINGDNTNKLLDKIVNNSDKIKDVVDDNLQLNLTKTTKDLGTNIDPFLLESMVVVDNNYHKKVMLSQVEMMKEFMKYLDIKKKFDESITEYKEGKVKIKSIEDKILDELKKFNLDSKMGAIQTELSSLKDENDKLKYLIQQKAKDMDDLALKFNANNINKDITKIDENEVNDDKLAKLLNDIDVESLSVYNINNRPIAEISTKGSFKIYKVGDIFEGFKIKSLEMDGMMISYINSKGIEKTKFINITKDLDLDDKFDILQIPESNFNGSSSQVVGKSTSTTPPKKPTTNTTSANTTRTNTSNPNTVDNSISNRFLEKLK